MVIASVYRQLVAETHNINLYYFQFQNHLTDVVHLYVY